MTDKEMIINGVDVSECEKIGETIDGITCGLGKRIRFVNEIITKHNLCKNNPNCHYKQFARKEQECEKLYIQLKADEEYHKEEENTLRKIIKNKEERNIELYKENNKLKQTLTEIKDICKTNVCKHCHSKFKVDDNYCKNIKDCDCYKILQKISECEVEND